MISAVVFDLDGVLLDSEKLWDTARREVVADHGGEWDDRATAAMQGMSSPEWAAHMHDFLGVGLPPEGIVDLVLEKLLAHYEEGLPWLPGAQEAVARLGAEWSLGLASSSNRVVIDRVLAAGELVGAFQATVSSEEVARGKPAPDVYLEVVRRLRQAPDRCAAIEDSANGIRSASAAGLMVVAVPNRDFPPPDDVVRMAALSVAALEQLTVEAVAGLGYDPDRRVDEEEEESFPASDAHSDWAGPPH